MTIPEYFKTFLKLLSKPLFEVGGNKITLFSILTALLIFIISLAVAKLVEGIVHRRLKNKRIDRGVKGSIERFSRYFVLLTGLLVALDIVGVNLKSLTALGAVLIVGIGFGLQNIAQNFISGIIILLERPIKQGDIIKVGDLEGRVIDIRVRSTIVSTRDDVSLIIPNSQLVTELVTNQSFSADRIRIHVRVGVAYGSDTQLVKEQMLAVADKHPSVLHEPAPIVIFENFGDSALEFDLRVWIEDLWFEDQLKSELRFAIDEAFRKKSIVIPFPQRDLHIKSNDTQGPFAVPPA